MSTLDRQIDKLEKLIDKRQKELNKKKLRAYTLKEKKEQATATHQIARDWLRTPDVYVYRTSCGAKLKMSKLKVVTVHKTKEIREFPNATYYESGINCKKCLAIIKKEYER